MKAINVITGEECIAVQATKPNGDIRMNVDGKFYSDKQFCKLFFIPTENIPSQIVLNIVSTLRNKKVLFLENDNTLDHGLDEFERILQANDIDYTVLFQIDEMPMEDITKAIHTHDAIVFMSQWVYDVSKKLLQYMRSLKEKKIVIECYISEPTWYYKKQHGSIHDVYIYSCMTHFGEADKETEKFYKITNKAYWDYKNNFDK